MFDFPFSVILRNTDVGLGKGNDMYFHVEDFGRIYAAKNTVIHDSYCDTAEHLIRKQKAWGFIAGFLLFLSWQ